MLGAMGAKMEQRFLVIEEGNAAVGNIPAVRLRSQIKAGQRARQLQWPPVQFDDTSGVGCFELKLIVRIQKSGVAAA